MTSDVSLLIRILVVLMACSFPLDYLQSSQLVAHVVVFLPKEAVTDDAQVLFIVPPEGPE
jgi:hypothetical protein